MEPNRQDPPPSTPNPTLGRTIMKLRINFPDDPESHSSSPRSNAVNESTERRTSLLLETIKNARREPATYQVDEDDTYPEGAIPWLADNERRDSIEQTRIKLATKSSGGSGRNKLQRDRKKVRETKRCNSGTFSDEGGRQRSEEFDKSETAQNSNQVAQEARNASDQTTFLHPLMRTVANAEKVLQEHYNIVQREDYGSQYAGSIPSSSSQYSYSTMSDEAASDSGQEQALRPTESSSSNTLTHDVYEELNKELTALVHELELKLPHSF